MLIRCSPWKNLVVVSALLGLHAGAQAVDALALELGSGNKVGAGRIALQWDWDRQWWQSNGSHIGGYWEAGLGQWRGSRFQNVPDTTQNLLDVGLTPVFRFERDDRKGAYAEAAIGLHYLSELYDNNGRKLSTHFQFGNHLGAGYVFSNKLDIGLRLQHYSNGGIKHPNSGVNFLGVRASYRF